MQFIAAAWTLGPVQFVCLKASCWSGNLLATAWLLSADSPGVTHVVYPFGPSGDPDDGQQYLRALERG